MNPAAAIAIRPVWQLVRIVKSCCGLCRHAVPAESRGPKKCPGDASRLGSLLDLPLAEKAAMAKIRFLRQLLLDGSRPQSTGTAGVAGAEAAAITQNAGATAANAGQFTRTQCRRCERRLCGPIAARDRM